MLLLLWTWLRLPEPKDRSYGELDVLFENRVSARNFAKTRVDQFAGDHTEIVKEDRSSAGSGDENKLGAQQHEFHAERNR